MHGPPAVQPGVISTLRWFCALLGRRPPLGYARGPGLDVGVGQPRHPHRNSLRRSKRRRRWGDRHPRDARRDETGSRLRGSIRDANPGARAAPQRHRNLPVWRHPRLGHRPGNFRHGDLPGTHLPADEGRPEHVRLRPIRYRRFAGPASDPHRLHAGERHQGHAQRHGHPAEDAVDGGFTDVHREPDRHASGPEGDRRRVGDVEGGLRKGHAGKALGRGVAVALGWADHRALR